MKEPDGGVTTLVAMNQMGNIGILIPLYPQTRYVRSIVTPGDMQISVTMEAYEAEPLAAIVEDEKMRAFVSWEYISERLEILGPL